MDMKASNAAINLIKKWEGLKLDAYVDPVGIWTIGWGTTKDVYPGQTITRAQAEAFLMRDIAQFAGQVNRLITASLTQGQFDALVSFTYNLGAGRLQSSTLRKKINANPDDPSIRYEFNRWVHGDGQVLPGLVKRRKFQSLF